MVENWAGKYISNDDFIDACLELGLLHEDLPGKVIGNPKYQYNKYFNIRPDKKKIKNIKWKYCQVLEA